MINRNNTLGAAFAPKTAAVRGLGEISPVFFGFVYHAN